MNDDTQTYLGDAVYASFDRYGIELSTNSGVREHKIYLEPFVLRALVDYALKVGIMEQKA
jgi:hypothetical protein